MNREGIQEIQELVEKLNQLKPEELYFIKGIITGMEEKEAEEENVQRHNERSVEDDRSMKKR